MKELIAQNKKLIFKETLLADHAECDYKKSKTLYILKKSNIVQEIFDKTLSILMLPIFLPLMAVISLIIKFTSDGPIFYSQQRVGQNRRPIWILKFRTMYIDSEKRLEKILSTNPEAKKDWEIFFKLKKDPRVTKIGKFLRKTSLDELPQIFNVLTGEMSLVGPRPVLQMEIDKYYKDHAKFYFLIKPGITGLWQTNGRNNTSYDHRVHLDTWYVLNRSLWLDIVILFKTIKVVLKADGAY